MHNWLNYVFPRISWVMPRAGRNFILHTVDGNHAEPRARLPLRLCNSIGLLRATHSTGPRQSCRKCEQTLLLLAVASSATVSGHRWHLPWWGSSLCGDWLPRVFFLLDSSSGQPCNRMCFSKLCISSNCKMLVVLLMSLPLAFHISFTLKMPVSWIKTCVLPLYL